jgi:hypothetical protein
MRYTLMHKNIPVMELTVNGELGNITAADSLHNPEHAPVGTLSADETVDMYILAKWWKHRAIPAHRPKLEQALDRLHVQTQLALILHGNGLSLSDQYWVRPKGSDLVWENVNYFQHPFPPDVGKALFGEAIPDGKPERASPDSTTDGMLKKRWEIFGDKRYLLKGGVGPFHQEPLNEEAASALLNRLNVPHVGYTVDWRDDRPYSFCENFLAPETEYIPAYFICKTQAVQPGYNLHPHYLSCCEALGIPGVQDSLDRMMAADNIFANSDRHFGNFGAVRNADTLEWLGAAPLFDHGNSLWNDTATQFIRSETGDRCRTFYRSHADQRHLITAFDWLDFAALDGFERECAMILGAGPFVDSIRCEAIGSALRRRIELLRKYAERQG